MKLLTNGVFFPPILILNTVFGETVMVSIFFANRCEYNAEGEPQWSVEVQFGIFTMKLMSLRTNEFKRGFVMRIVID